ncbi:carcinoembryonic antigen-related cell adhesion molecule 1-like [Rana temporaria]|uniref:carcinoembryonic antigen-related cell adhesion molecule 1-like n=1 Tax=Rana temporaria TaxID=8407 RepID=UPI001AAC828D|nr:carcinoembryonic antigen-related cell adhesion molecule 1-like [Rana temporaria]
MPRNWFWRLWAIWLISSEPASAVSRVNGTLGGSVSFHQFVYWKAPLEWRFGDDEVVAVRPFYGAPYCYPRYQGRCQLSIEGALQLNNLTYSDQGQYVFIVGAIEPYRSQIVYYQLQIYSPLNVPVLILNAAHNRLVSGSNVTFHCDGGNQNITTYLFYRDGKKICSEPHVTCRDSYLYIQPITGSDSGRYTCTIHNPVSSNISNVLLVTVSAALTAPALVPNSAPNHLLNGSYASFHCDAGEQHVATYTFYRDGKNICSEPHVTCRDSYLYFQTISKHDSGRYTCTIQNTAGTSSTSNILQLSVSAPTSAAVLTSNQTELVWEGESVTFNCSTLTAANFTWNVNGSSLPGGGHYYILLDPERQFTTLTLSPVSTNDTGSYTCEARNTTMNETSNALILNVGIAPTNTSIYCGSEAYAGGVVLICSWAGGQPAADIQLSFNGTLINEKDAVNLNVLLSNEVQQPELVCQGNQTGRISECKTTFERPASSSHDNNAITSAIEGQNATLNVSLTSQSSLISDFTWFSPNLSPVNVSDGKYKVETIGSQSILSISNLTVSDNNGTFRCTARNVIGSTTFNFILDVQSQGSNDSGGSSGSSGLSGGAIAGIVIGVLAGVALIGVGGYFLVKKVF